MSKMRELVPVLVAGATPFVILVLIIVGLGSHSIQWQPQTYWTREFGTGPLGVQLSAVTGLVWQGGAVYAAGFYGENSPTQPYLFLKRYGASGEEIWTDRIGNPSFSQISSLGASDGIYLGGATNGTGFVEKYDVNGNRIWQVQFGNYTPVGNGGLAASLSAQPSAVYVAGISASGPSTFTILNKYDLQGDLVWTRVLGTTLIHAGSEPSPVTVYSNGRGIFVAGYATSLYSGALSPYLEAYNENGTLRWSQTLNSTSSPCDCRPTGDQSDGTGLFVAGYVPTSYGYDAFLRKYDWSGNMDWARQFGSPNLSGVYGLRVSANSSGAYLVDGYFVFKYDAGGNSVWTLTQGCGCDRISVGDNAVYIGGSSSSSNAIVAAFGLSSTLILFGMNPPGSFLLVTAFAGAVVASVLFFRKRARTRIRSHLKPLRPGKGLPADASGRAAQLSTDMSWLAESHAIPAESAPYYRLSCRLTFRAASTNESLYRILLNPATLSRQRLPLAGGGQAP